MRESLLLVEGDLKKRGFVPTSGDFSRESSLMSLFSDANKRITRSYKNNRSFVTVSLKARGDDRTEMSVTESSSKDLSRKE